MDTEKKSAVEFNPKLAFAVRVAIGWGGHYGRGDSAHDALMTLIKTVPQPEYGELLSQAEKGNLSFFQGVTGVGEDGTIFSLSADNAESMGIKSGKMSKDEIIEDVEDLKDIIHEEILMELDAAIVLLSEANEKGFGRRKISGGAKRQAAQAIDKVAELIVD